jgi:hypothetical protein
LDDYIYTSDDELLEGEIDEGRRYTESDFNRIIEIEAQEKYRVKLFMDAIDQGEKTLVFCASQAHALAVRDLVNKMSTSTEPNYCVRVTANDGALGEQFLRVFQDNEKTIPTILTTSQKLSTGVDARNVRNIVLMRPILPAGLFRLHHHRRMPPRRRQRRRHLARHPELLLARRAARPDRHAQAPGQRRISGSRCTSLTEGIGRHCEVPCRSNPASRRRKLDCRWARNDDA